MNPNDSLLEVYIYENEQLLETLEALLLVGEKEQTLTPPQIDEVFRIMHTIKGSSSMMQFDSLAHVAHAIEDLFSQIRDKGARSNDWGNLFDIVLGGADFIKAEFAKIQSGQQPDGHADELIDKIHGYLDLLKQRKPPQEDSGEHISPISEDEQVYDEDLDAILPIYKIKITFEPDCKMEHIRAFAAVNALDKFCHKLAHIPEDLMTADSCQPIIDSGFLIYAQSGENPDNLRKILEEVMFVQSHSMIPIDHDNDEIPDSVRPKPPKSANAATAGAGAGSAPAVADLKASQAAPPAETIVKQNFISVNVNKLDNLLDLVGEIVTTESMVTKNPDLDGLQLDNFESAAQQLRSLTTELQDIVMSIRMLPVSTTFHKMQRIVRDMSKKISKDIDLVIIGEETEVDKNIIDNLSDPLMHIIRNSVDHGIESEEERVRKGKSPKGKITLEASNTGGDVNIIVSDDGKGLDRDVLLKKASERGILNRPESEYTDREVYSLIFAPGFSTKEQVTEFSGRGVGMDVVRKGIEKIGGSVSIDSGKDIGTTTTIRIPLTLAIVDGMNVTVGPLSFIVPILSIRETFKPDLKSIFLDPDGNENIMIRDERFSILRLDRFYNIEGAYQNFEDGLLMLVESDGQGFCIFVDQLIGEQQVVVKPMPAYIQKVSSNMNGLGGCTILGDGTISLIMDIKSLSF